MSEQLVTLVSGVDDPDYAQLGWPEAQLQSLAVVTINRPDAMNALSVRMAEQLSSVMEQLYTDTQVRCVVLKAAGKYFMAGGDIDGFATPIQADDEAALLNGVDELIEHAQEAIRWIRYCPKPVIAQVQGGAAGYGVSLLLSCDFAYTTDDAVFTLAYSNLGTSPDGGASFFLPRMAGTRKATELLMLSDRVSGSDAEQLGLVNAAVAPAELDSTVTALVKRCLEGPTVSYGRIKALLNSSSSLSLSDQLASEVQSFKACALSDDFKEGVNAFMAKRPGKFQGR